MVMDLSNEITGFTSLSWLPKFIELLGIPVWISDPNRRFCYVNDRGESLLGVRANRCLGRPCSRVVQGHDPAGEPFCSRACPLLQTVRAEREISPVTIRVGGPESPEHWVQLLLIPIWSPDSDDPWLVHCALDADRSHNMERYLGRVATRTLSCGGGESMADRRTLARRELTRREREILELLGRDEDLFAIARRLHVSHVTVRNHVQHILTKIGAHSVPEAVARWLLVGEQGLHDQVWPEDLPTR